MIETVTVDLGSRSYDILIGFGIFEEIPERLKKDPIASEYAIITDSGLENYGNQLYENLRRAGLIVPLIHTFPAGEQSKSWEEAGRAGGLLYGAGLTRKSGILALGGGVVGDLAGFVASFYMRGVPYGQIPTTLLSQVDSSIGGKTGVNYVGKNIFGTFYQPKRVFTDPNFLISLPPEEIRSGTSEAEKTMVVGDREGFEYLEANIDRFSRLEEGVVLEVITRCVRVKADVVSEDEREANKRAILNYGHTIGHALEALSGWEIRHGDAVGDGMRGAATIAVNKGFLSRADQERQNRLLDRVKPATRISFDKDKLVRLLYADKKAERGQIMFVLPKEIGAMATIDGRYKIPVSEDEVREALQQF